MSIHAIFWDIGGVLLRNMDTQPRRDLAEILEIDAMSLEHLMFGKTDNFRVQFGEISLEEHYENVRQRLNLTPEAMAQVWEQYFVGDQIDMDLVEYIRKLSQDYYTAVISNFWSKLRHNINEEWQIGDAFKDLIVSAEVGLMKPAPAIYALAVERSGFLPQECVFLDDFIENVIGARDVGMHAIHFKDPNQARQELDALLNK